MQVFVYEFFTGGGGSEFPQSVGAASLLTEAAAMVRAVTEDLVALPLVRVVTTRNGRLPAFHPVGCRVVELGHGRSDMDIIARLSTESDWTLLIAPETAGALLMRAQLVERRGGRLLSPGSDFIQIAADKHVTVEVLHRAGVPVPKGAVWSKGEPPSSVSFPAVIKPTDGCGSQDLRRVNSAEQLLDVGAGHWRLEEYVAGTPASVSVLCGPNRNWPLAACEQRLSDDGHFSYLGGRVPLAPEFDHRARRLALQAIEALPPTIGYVGVDLVLSDATDGSGDYVIEVNPRLTTSYVGLRAASRSNLAAAMLAAARGDEPVLSFRPEPVEFTSAGEILGSRDQIGSQLI
ncbi:MAG TPA: ATP-grasp domain-containing protein [Pirellulaceae bacterium]|jgi:hypothetical protein